jgi:beta-N-acetylhexosaminidase
LTPRRRLFWIWIIFGMLGSALMPAGSVHALQVAQTPDPSQRARVLFDNMTAEERVGQLFLVTFRGRDVTTKDSKILDLIANRHIGGVVLRAANDNFTSANTVLEDVLKLNLDMQTARWTASQKTVRSPAGYTYTPRYVPLLIGMAQEGDLYPNDQLLSGLTALPSGMALGATWDPKQAERVGGVLGNELSVLGFNLLLGPSLDLAESPEAEGVADLGVRVLGGNPFWVGELGRAYIRGLHQGSKQRLAVVARSFPGVGEADRPAEEEVGTVRKTLDQLKQTDLAPFFAVTGNAGSTDAMTDGLLVSNIRYQGLQGGIRPATRPLSFDTAALDQLLALPDLARWRQAGGVVVSDNLGSAALRKFYESTGQTFDPRQLARSAFLGGSDLLYSDNLQAPGDVDSYATLTTVLDFFIQKYREDPAFAQRVDLSVQRILALKYKLYGDFTLDTVNSSATRLKEVGQSQQVVFDLARQAVTLIHPTQAEISQVLPRPPELRERMLFLTDVVTYRQCNSCPTQSALAVDALQNVVARLYGPRAGGQINPANLFSYSFLDLKYYLDESKDKIPAGLDDNLKLADWVVVALVNTNSTRPEAQAFRQLLSKRPDLLRNKKIVVFTFNTPYGLDATDISKVNAYYALYSKTLPFIEVAARILFQELTPGGALPVSVPGAGYNLQDALAPDPGQVIALEVDLPVVTATTPQAVTGTPRPGVTPSATPTVVPTVKMGDMLPLRTGVIYDHNHFPVPDGTLVKFIFTPAGSEGGVMQQINAITLGGIARASYRIQNGGSLEVRVISEPALTSQQLRLNISLSGTVAITAVIPTLTFTPTPSPTLTLTPTPTSTFTPTSTPLPPPPPKPGAGDWFLSLLVAWGMGGVAFWAGRTISSLRWGVRWGLLTAVSGMFAYTYLIVGLPGGKNILDASGMVALVWLTLLGALLGWLAGFAWREWAERDKKKVKIG